MTCNGNCRSLNVITEYLCNDNCISIYNSCDGICAFRDIEPNCHGKCEYKNIGMRYFCNDSNVVCKWPMKKCHNVDICIDYDYFCNGDLEVNLLKECPVELRSSKALCKRHKNDQLYNNSSR